MYSRTLLLLCVLQFSNGFNSSAAEGDKASPELIAMILKTLDSPDAETRKSSITSIEALGPKALAAAGPILDKIRKAASPEISIDCARALVRLGPGIQPEVEKSIQGKEARVLMSVSMAASERGVEMQPVLKQLAAYPSEMVSAPAKSTLAKLDSAAPTPQPPTTAPVERPRPNEPEPNFATAGESALPELIKALEHPKFSVRTNALLALARLGPKAKSALPAITAAREKEPPNNQRIYADTIRFITGVADKSALSLDEMLRTPPNSKEAGQQRNDLEMALLELRNRKNPEDVKSHLPGMQERVLLTDYTNPNRSYSAEEYCFTFLEMQGKAQVPLLLQVLKKTPEVTKLLVRNGLMEVPKPQRVEILEGLAESGGDLALWVAFEDLRNFYDPGPVEFKVWSAVFKSKNNVDLKMEVLEKLLNKKPEEIMLLKTELNTLMSDPDEGVRKRCEALARKINRK